MASIVDSFNEALTEDYSYVKIALYTIPAFIVAKFYLVGNMVQFSFWGVVFGILFLGLLTQGINNVRMNRREILTINPVKIGIAIVKSLIVLVPQVLVLGLVGNFCVNNIQIPLELPHISFIFSIIVWAIICSIVLTSYLSFAKYLKVAQGYNFKVIFESCTDVFISFLFFIPQLLIANFILIGPVWYLFSVFHVPFTNWGFVAYCSAAFVVNISILSNYLAQAAYEQIKGNNEEYDENVQMNIIEAASERMNGH